MYNTNSKRKSMIFSKKKNFFNIFNFFSKGGTLWCRNRQKKFFPFFKNFKNKTQKWLSWDHSNINRNKVMNFGGRSSYPAETARRFTVVWAIMAPPLPRTGLNEFWFVFKLAWTAILGTKMNIQGQKWLALQFLVIFRYINCRAGPFKVCFKPNLKYKIRLLKVMFIKATILNVKPHAACNL